MKCENLNQMEWYHSSIFEHHSNFEMEKMIYYVVRPENDDGYRRIDSIQVTMADSMIARSALLVHSQRYCQQKPTQLNTE